MSRIMVLDANQRSALAIVRSLGRKQQHVIVADHTHDTLAGASKYAAQSVVYADPARAPAQFIADVRSVARELGVEMIVPATDLTSMLLVDATADLEGIRVAAPAANSYEMLTDKGALLKLAGELGIAAPATRIAHDTGAIRAAAAEFGYPLVLKPARSRYRRGENIVSTAVVIVRSPERLEAALAKLDWLQDIPCLVQQFVPGHGAGIFALYGASRPIAWFSHRRIREKPPSGGVSVLSESAALDPRMREVAERLLAAARWSGVAMIEFRVAADGTPYLMEVNGRFWGSLQLAIDSGVDFPWLLYQLVHGDTPAHAKDYRLGTRLRWLLGDVDNLLIQARSGDLGWPAKLGALGRFTATFADLGCRQEIFRWHDPAPGLHEARRWVGALLQ
jgi:predicted ATP-grasp superfamily ATP-dependent carboligase